MASAIVLTVVSVTFIAVLTYFVKKGESPDTFYPADPAAAIGQYRQWKTTATSYSDMEELNAMIDEARNEIKRRNG